MSDIKLGNLITNDVFRDAIHVAICPVVSDETLKPGEHVGLVKDSTERVETSNVPIGIVDPFLKAQVHPGQKCWLLLYPQTVTSLRHEWTHPAFPYFVRDERHKAKTLLAKIADRIGCRLEDLLVRLEIYARGSCGDDDGIQEGLNQLDELVRATMWGAFEVVREVKVPNDIKEATYFNCAC